MALALALALALGATPAPPAERGAAEEVTAADAGMSRAVEARDAAAFGAFLHADAIFANARGLSGGRDVVLAEWRPYLTAGGPTLAWSPERAVVSASGDLAVTIGRFTWRGSADGSPATAEGEYVTVWARGEDGRWRVLVDASLEPAERLGPGLVRDPLRVFTSGAGDLEATLGRWRRGSESGAYLTIARGQTPSAETAVDTAFAFRRPR